MKTRGFIALISVMIIGFALLALAASASVGALFAGLDALDAEDAANAREAARSCADIAGLMALRDSSYAGGDTIPVGDSACRIDAVDGSIVYASAEYGGASAYVRAVIKDGAVTEADEIPSEP